MNKDNAVKIIKYFRDDYCNSDIKKIPNRTFKGICDNYMNSDSSKYAKAFYLLLWDDIPYIENFDEYYGGDTINSFNTLFNNGVNIREKFKDDNAFLQKIENFESKVYCLANFMPMPKKKPKDAYYQKTINEYRSLGNISNSETIYYYKDYFDVFLKNMKNIFEVAEKNKIDEHLEALVDANNFYFGEKYINYDIKTFRIKNYLDNYIDKRGTILIDFQKHYTAGDYNVTDFKDIVSEYIDVVTNLIDNRAIKIAEALKKYKELK